VAKTAARLPGRASQPERVYGAMSRAARCLGRAVRSGDRWPSHKPEAGSRLMGRPESHAPPQERQFRYDCTRRNRVMPPIPTYIRISSVFSNFNSFGGTNPFGIQSSESELPHQGGVCL
jgi:hypothetical protein